MNFLAHAFLSFNHPEILVGNMVSDFVKGKKQYDFPAAIRTGIVLHRAIDAYTDLHPVTRAMKNFYKEEYGLYGSVLADVSYDYFLANDENLFPKDESLLSFTKATYDHIADHEDILPENFLMAFSYMKKQDWLFHYRSDEGIAKSFAGVQRRSSYMKTTDIAMQIFKENKLPMQSLYEEFFPELQEYALTKLEALISSACISLK